MIDSTTVVVRGTERYHMEEYLIKRGFRREGADVFSSMDIRAVFEAQRKFLLGSLPITEVEVRFEGASEKAREEAEAFRLRFMTAGG